MIKVLNMRDPDPDPDNSIVINVCSNCKYWSRDLSPFLLGPVKLYDGYIAQNVENAWQYSKCYKDHVIYKDNKTILQKEWVEWAKNGWNQKKGIRYPMGKGTIPEFSIWTNKLFNYIEARKNIYIPLYARTVRQTRAFKKLKRLYEKKKELYLKDFDGYDYISLNMSLNDVLNNPNKIMGHAHVLVMMLKGYVRVYSDGTVNIFGYIWNY